MNKEQQEDEAAAKAWFNKNFDWRYNFNGDSIAVLTEETFLKYCAHARQLSQTGGMRFPQPKEWLAGFKRGWYKDNDRGVLPKQQVDKMWQDTERTCNMIYKYQRAAFEKQTAAIPQTPEKEIMDLLDDMADALPVLKSHRNFVTDWSAVDKLLTRYNQLKSK